MTAMQAVWLAGHGGNEVVQVGARPFPSRTAGEVLVRIHAAGLNRVDLYMRNSGAGIRHSLPLVMGLDGAGTVLEAEPGSGFEPGDRVVIHPGVNCGHCEFCRVGQTVLCTSMRLMGEHIDGTLAEVVSVPSPNLFPIPTGWSFAEAAAVSVGHLTAWRMLHTQGGLRPWETVLIFGIGGTVSLAALQLAKLAGARVIVTSRDPEKSKRALSMGADDAITGTAAIASQVLEMTGGRGVDLVIENVGEAVWPEALKSLVRGGRIVTCGATTGSAPSADLQRMFIRQLRVIGSTHGTLGEFADLLAMLGRSTIRPVIDSRFAMADVHAALNRLESGQQFGKVAVEVVPD